MVDARGYLCPMPVVMVQNAIKKDNPAALEVLVDNETAVENIKRFAAHSGYQAAAVKTARLSPDTHEEISNTQNKKP